MHASLGMAIPCQVLTWRSNHEGNSDLLVHPQNLCKPKGISYVQVVDTPLTPHPAPRRILGHKESVGKNR